MKRKTKKGGRGAKKGSKLEVHKDNHRSARCCRPLRPSQLSALSRVRTNSKDSEREYQVQKIIGRQVQENDIKYLVKWAGYPKSYNTWESYNNFQNCEDLIIEFEQRLNANRKPKIGGLEISTRTRSMAQMESIPQFEPPFELTGAGRIDGQLHFQVIWNKGDISREMVPAKVANEYWPISVLRFYEQRIKWKIF